MLYRAIFVPFCFYCWLFQIYVTADETPRIIIIGSGAAGIAAASRLLQNGFDNITILEAENRIGGRVYTTKFNDYWIDVGGQWIHGEENNVAYELAWPLGVVEKSNTSWNFKCFSSSGPMLSEETGNNLMEFYMQLARSKTPNEYLNKSIGEYYKFKLEEYFKTNPDIRIDHRESLENMLDLFEMSQDAGDSWLEVSAKGLEEYTRCAGDEGINWKDRGYGTILDILMKKFPNPAEELPVLNNTVLNTEVLNINYNVSHENVSPVHVVTKNGDEYPAEHVIVTVSLGVLKSDYKTLFNPPLPEAKVNVIKGLEFGTVAKIYLFYPEPWWNGTEGYSLYWTNEDRNEFANNPEKSWMLGLFTIVHVEHKPRLLCCWLAGPHAREMENIPEERVFNQTKELLHRFLGKTYNLTEPTAMLRSQWFSNKHFRGTYSYRSLATERSGVMAVDLSEPITKQENPLVLFAGEATSPHYYSTVHGAIESGWREADRLIKRYNDRQLKTATTEAS